MSHRPQTLYEKIWRRHLVDDETPTRPAILYVDLHLIHEVTSPQAFDVLRARNLPVARPERTLGMMDHAVPTTAPDADGVRRFGSEAARKQVDAFIENCGEFGVQYHGWDSDHRGIVHVAGPELGRTLPGMTVVCGDSHTCTHGAFGALGFGIGTTEVGHVLATQCLFQRKSKSMLVRLDGVPPKNVTAKDLALRIINEIGVDGGNGSVIEYAGEAVRRLSMEGRMTLCNMSIEAGARSGLVEPDETTADWLAGRNENLKGAALEHQRARWRSLKTDDGAEFDKVATVNAADARPMITYGTMPGASLALGDVVPPPADAGRREALAYMQLEAGRPMDGQPVGTVFVGSCTNGRLSDLRHAAEVLKGRKVAQGVRMLIVPGSQAVKRQAEAEGLAEIFVQAGAEWREAGCSMCIAMNGDVASPDALTVSTSNRNFPGRQGPGARTVLANPAVAAAAAVAGRIADPATLEGAS